MNTPAPVAERERVVLLDVLRGFALYGVLLANTVDWYSGMSFMSQGEREALFTKADKVAGFFVHTLVAGKAMTLLTFLFGVGFAIQMERASAAQRSGLSLYFRRLLALFTLGVCHVGLLWSGDILWGYAIGGCALVLFRRMSLRATLITSAALMVIPQLVASMPPVADRLHAVLPGPSDHEAFRAQVLVALRGHNFVERARLQALDAIYFAASIAPWYFPWLVGRFALGYCAGKSRVLHDASAHLPFFRRLLGWGLGLGFVGAAFSAVRHGLRAYEIKPSPWGAFGMMAPADVCILGAAGAYLAAIVLLMERPAWRRRLMVLAPVGRMPLTTYLGQSLICTFIFFGWGLGLIGRVGTALCVPLTLAIFAGQVAFAHVWLRRFRFGPMEWVWRSLTYARLQPMLPLAGGQ